MSDDENNSNTKQTPRMSDDENNSNTKQTPSLSDDETNSNLKHFKQELLFPYENDARTCKIYECNCVSTTQLSCSGFCGLCCWCYLNYENAEPLEMSSSICCLLGFPLPCIASLLQRMKAREIYNIKGSSLEDLLASFFCPCCVNCQIAVEIEENQNMASLNVEPITVQPK